MKEHRQITEILDQVEEHLPVGSKIIVACSGGADSIALADALLLLQEKRKYQLVVCHVEHGLRGSEAWLMLILLWNSAGCVRLPVKFCVLTLKNLLRRVNFL